MMPTLKAIHICNSLKPSHEPKIAKEYVLPALTEKKYDRTTSCIVHLADSANFKGVTFNKRCSGSTGLCFESPNDTIHVTVGTKPKKELPTMKILLHKD